MTPRALLTAIAIVALAITPARAGVVTHRASSVNDSGGDGDGFIEPGEPFTLRESVDHKRQISFCGVFMLPDCSTPGDRTNVRGTVAAPTSAFDFTRPSSRYPDIPEDSGHGTNVKAFRGRVMRDARCGRAVPLGLLLSSNEANDSVPFQLVLGAPGPAKSLSSSDVPKPIRLVGAGGTKSALTVAGPGLIRDIDVRIDSITHPKDSELDIGLIPPDGYVNWLANEVGGSGANYRNTIFDDEAHASISSGSAPFSGRFNAGGRLAAQTGKPAKGTWKLLVEDQAAGNDGTIDSWGLDIRRSVCSVAPKARFTASRAVVGSPVVFDASPSVGVIVKYRWDLDGNGTFETSGGAHPKASRTYATVGTVRVGLQVTDSHGSQSVYTRTLKVHPG